jgi:phosphoglycolate phosphatase-like HAD superfamily hydrolase
MTLAFSRLHGCEGALEHIAIAGRTDRAIVTDAMRAQGIEPTDAAIAALRDAYVESLAAEILTPPAEHPSLVLPGILPLLDALTTVPHATSALLTGNFEKGAAVKLGHFGLWDRFRFGAFGDDHVDRRALVPIALARAQAAGIATPKDVVIIGDTPHDIDCAKANGARAIGVATGPFDRAALAEAGADLSLDTLEPVDQVMGWLAG